MEDRNDNSSETKKWKPGVHKSALLLIAGLTWIGVGIMLDGWSYSWLKNENPSSLLLMSMIGFLLGLIIHHFGFLRIVDKNLGRIMPMEGKQCVFSFMPWKSYALILTMILIGYILRHSALPKYYLAIVYLGIGTALILSSVRYLRYVVLEIKNKDILSKLS
ncbi:MAG: hypothetical protein V2B13_18255 [Pseudomonadota bacterium]